MTLACLYVVHAPALDFCRTNFDLEESAAGIPAVNATAKLSSGTERPSPSTLMYASFRVQQEKKFLLAGRSAVPAGFALPLLKKASRNVVSCKLDINSLDIDPTVNPPDG